MPPTATSDTASKAEQLVARDLLPDGAQFLADTVADVGLEGAQAAVIAYRWPIFVPLAWSLIPWDGPALHVMVHPLNGAQYVPEQEPKQDSPLRLVVVDLNDDGLSDVITVPRRDGMAEFSNHVLASWSRILSAAKIEFYGGHMASEYDDRFYFYRVPVIYDAGPKRVSFEDVDGDGLIEVDVAYSLEAGAEIWLVDRYRWDGDRFVYSETLPRRPDALMPYDRYEDMLAAIEPLPALEYVGKTKMIPQEVQIQTQEIIEFDLDADGSPETLWTYRLRPIYKEPTLAPVYELWLAVLDGDGRLLWQEQIQNIEALCSLSISTTPVQLGPGLTGILVLRLSQNNACRGGPLGTAILYGWRDGRLVRLLDRMVSNSGVASGDLVFRESVSLRDVDDDGWAEVLLSDRYRFFAMDHGITAAYGRYPSYDLYWPGTLALQRDTNTSTYLPAYYMHGEQRMSIRSSWPTAFAPRLSQPLVIDGYHNDWWQVEYNAWNPLHIENDTVDLIRRASPLPAVSWDDQMFYMVTDKTGPGRTITITLDTDLSSDFADTTLDEDDYVFVLTIPEPRPTDDEQRDVVTVRTLNPGGKQVDVQAVTVLSRARNQRLLEIAIPLDQVGLDSATLVPTPGWVGGSAGEIGEREYHPCAGQAIGLAVDVSGWVSSDAYRMDDPTTWNTLIFMADR